MTLFFSCVTFFFVGWTCCTIVMAFSKRRNVEDLMDWIIEETEANNAS